METSKGQSDDAVTPKRKRKASKHGKPAVATLSPPVEEEPRPSKRKKLTESPTDNIEDGRNTEKASTTVTDNSPVKAQVNGSPSIETSNDATIQQGTVKKGKRKQVGKGLTGFFSQDEVQALENFKIEFCNSHGLSSHAFDAMVQHSEREKGIEFPCDSSITMKPEFWKTIYKILPDRDRRSVYRFMRRHFQNSDVKPHHWTHEQDEELIQLVARYGFKFAQIAKELGRSDDDVVQRWKNRLEHRTTMNRGAWSEEEIRSLQNALQAVWKNLKEKGHDVGRDIYEMDETLISWGHISNKLKNCRSRQQCADKWRKARKKVQQLRDKGNPDAVFDPVKESKKNRRKSRTGTPSSSQTPQTLHKSAEYVHSDDSDDEAAHQDGKTGESGKASIKESTSNDKSSSPDSESESTDDSRSGDTTEDVKSNAKRSERPKIKDQLQATEPKKSTKTTPQKRKQSTSSSSASDSEGSDSSTGSDVPAHLQTSTNGMSKTSPVAPKNKDKVEKSSSEDDSSDSSDDGSSESDGESDESESDVTSSSGNEKGKSPKKTSNNIKQQPKKSSSEESSSADESESDDSDSAESEFESTPAMPKPSKSKKKSTKEAGAMKRRRVAELSSTSTSARSSVSRDIKMEVTSD
ncbi:hypothetical protein BDV35DRAFT_333152 [Aspergillus flavus]|uniref:MYB DNA-binding domain protein n=2 Tax=Aspergillus subgen. Circumdati TaxID=2720871 RepID=A0A5N6HF89_ASPFL|nr:hypothetical protein BDV35DRAFT_333152 [Aspergillus flavus]GMG50213.1 unnamed protein product [Aspergillus oryzae var. brunneus]